MLQELNLKNLPLEQVDPFVLAPVKFTLTSLLVEKCLDSINPRVFTGSTTMDNLAIVSFEYNILEDALTDDSFAMIPSLSSLYLRRSHIKTLQEGMFASISKSIEQIHLDGNELKTIEEGVFDSLLEKKVKIYLKDNPLMCDCGLAYLKELMKRYSSMFGEVRCAEPFEFSGWLVTEAEFCNAITEPPTTITTTTTTEVITVTDNTVVTEDTTEPTTETTESVKPQPPTRPTGEPTKPTGPPPTHTTSTVKTTSTSIIPEPPVPPSTTSDASSSTAATEPSTSTTHSTSSPANIFTMQCILTAVPIQSNITAYQGSELTLHKRSKTFTILESQEGAVELIFDQSYSFAIEDSAGCADIYGRTVRITNLIPDKNYVFCVVYRVENTISPFDCLPHRLLPTYGQRTWLIEDQKITIISILIASVLVAIMSGVVLTYCFIKSFDTYQKSCRKVTTELRIDRSTTNQCYMTPVAEQPVRSRHKRSVSDTSVESCRSYVSAVVPATQFQYISWKMDNRSRHTPSAPPHPTQQQSSMEYYPKDPPPPPLPPHPTKRLKKQKSEIKINFHEIYDEPNSDSYTSSVHKKCHQGKY